MLKAAAVVAAAVCLLCSPAGAAVLTITQVTEQPDSDFDDPSGQDNFMPEFNPSLGTLLSVKVSVRATLDWAESIIVSAPTTASTFGNLIIDSTGPGGNGPTTGLDEIDLTGKVHVPPGVQVTGNPFHFADTVSDNPANFLVAGEPEDIFLATGAFVTSCSPPVCIQTGEGAGGTLLGTLTTRFFYRPAHAVPEPSSVALLAIGLLLTCGSLRAGGRRHKRA